MPFSPSPRGFDKNILNPLKQFRAVVTNPRQDVPGEIAAMGTCFNNLDRTRLGLALQKPFGKLKSEQFTKQVSDADTGVKVAISANRVLFLFIKSIIGTIKGQAHEFFEWDGPSPLDLGRNYFKEMIQQLGGLVRI